MRKPIQIFLLCLAFAQAACGLPARTAEPTLPGPAAATPALVAMETAAVPTLPTPTLTVDAPPDVFRTAQSLSGGVNLGNALEAPNEGEWGVTLRQEYFDAIQQGGFHAVRVPIRWDTHALEAAPYTISPAFFARIDEVTGWGLTRGLRVIINFHHYEGLLENPDEQRERYLALWRQVAEHYRDYPPELVFELMNEPNGNLSAERWNRLLVEALAVVRESNPTRAVVIGGEGWNSIEQLEALQLPENDRNIIATFHYYSPFEFTHQGAEWAEGMDQYVGTQWTGTDEEKAAIRADLDAAADWAKKHNRPMLMGEFGAYSRADMDSRVRWTSFMAREAEKRAIAWIYWEFCAGFGVYDPQTMQYREALLKALIP